MNATRIAVFLGIVMTVTGLVHYYLWSRLVRAPEWPAPWTNVGLWMIVALALSIPGGFIASRVLPPQMTTPLAWIAFVWMGAMFIALMLLLPTELVRLAAGWLARGDEVASPERRVMISRWIAGSVMAGTAGLSAFSVVTALRRVDVKNVRVPIAGLAPGLEGFSIAQLTDVHVGSTIRRQFIEQLVETTNALEPDVIAITGDLVDGSVADLREHIAPLAELRARHGVFFVTGNHEYYSGAEAWIAHLGSLGIVVLANERVSLEHDGEVIDIAGVHDWSAGRFGDGPDMHAALADKPDDRRVVLLAHQPKHIDEARAHGVDLQLSGHTHGGQIFPFNYFVRLQQPFVQGLHQLGQTALYVSPGTGYWGPPMRLGIPAEITHLALRRA